MSTKRYAQWCGLAHALDRVGGRWTLLIVRELLIGPKRYSDLQANLHGIATNLLTERLRQFESDGLVRRREIPTPTPAALYELTEEGHELKEAVLTLIRWGGRFLPAAPRDDAFGEGWLVLALEAVLAPRASRTPDAAFSVRVESEGSVAWLAIESGEVTAGVGEPASFDLSLRGNPRLILAMVSGYLPLSTAVEQGLSLEGPARSKRMLARLAA